MKVKDIDNLMSLSTGKVRANNGPSKSSRYGVIANTVKVWPWNWWSMKDNRVTISDSLQTVQNYVYKFRRYEVFAKQVKYQFCC